MGTSHLAHVRRRICSRGRPRPRPAAWRSSRSGLVTNPATGPEIRSRGGIGLTYSGAMSADCRSASTSAGRGYRYRAQASSTASSKASVWRRTSRDRGTTQTARTRAGHAGEDEAVFPTDPCHLGDHCPHGVLDGFGIHLAKSAVQPDELQSVTRHNYHWPTEPRPSILIDGGSMAVPVAPTKRSRRRRPGSWRL